MKKVLILFIFCIFITGINVYALDLSTEQKALVETMDAFYQRSRYFQYDGYKFAYDTTPEMATSQNMIYTHCSNFAYLVYKNALGMETFKNSSLFTAHAYLDQSSVDVINVWDKSELDTIKSTYQNNYAGFLADVLGDDLQVGDIITEMRESSAHTMLIYDIEYDSSNKVTGVTLMEANAKYESESTKLDNRGLSYDATGAILKPDSQTKMNSFLFNNSSGTYRILSLLRPLTLKNTTNENQYVFANCDREKNASIYDMSKFHCDVSTKSFSLTDSAKSRMKYSKMDIDKTITNDNGIINGSDVNLGDEIIYNIKISNNSSSRYTDLIVKENVSSYVDVVTHNGELSGNTISWKIDIDANSSKTISYKVKVKNIPSNLGKDIISTGFVDNIKTATVNNTINITFTSDDMTKIKNAYNDLKTSSGKTGLDFVNNVFKKAFNTDLKLDKFEIDKLVDNTVSSNSPFTLKINSNSEYSDLVFNDYYGALRKTSSGTYIMKYWSENWLSNSWTGTDVDDRNSRQTNIYREHFKTGDILIFSNTDDSKTNDDGVYAYVFVDNSFYGINKDNKNEFSTSAVLSNGNSYLNTLFGKDYYVVLRPSYRINHYELVSSPNTFYNFNKVTIVVSLLLLVVGTCVLLKTFTRKNINNNE